MKRRAINISPADDATSRKKQNIDSLVSQPLSPRRRAFSRQCKFEKGEKVIAFYGGWPYVGSVTSVAQVLMSFGSTFVLLIRWNGFSGKNAISWISEFDVMKHNEAALKLKSDMEEMQREIIKQSGGKPDKVKQRKIFLRVVSHFRGKRLCPLRPVSAPYPDEWQTIIRMLAIPKTLVEHLRETENLIYEKKIVLPKVGHESFWKVLSDWIKDMPERFEYAYLVRDLFNKFFTRILLYRFELPEVTKLIFEGCPDSDFAKVASVEYFLRLASILPEIVTAASHGSLNRTGDHEIIHPLLDFVNAHQLFLSHLEANVETLLRAPIRKSTLDESLPDDYAIDYSARDSKEMKQIESDELLLSAPRTRKYMNKRKKCTPVQKLPPNETKCTNMTN